MLTAVRMSLFPVLRGMLQVFTGKSPAAPPFLGEWGEAGAPRDVGLILVGRPGPRYADGMTHFEKEELAQQLATRVTDLEMLFTHLQRTVHDLDQVLVQQQRRFDAMEQTLRRLTHDLESVSGVVEPRRDPVEERPPHY